MELVGGQCYLYVAECVSSMTGSGIESIKFVIFKFVEWFDCLISTVRGMLEVLNWNICLKRHMLARNFYGWR